MADLVDQTQTIALIHFGYLNRLDCHEFDAVVSAAIQNVTVALSKLYFRRWILAMDHKKSIFLNKKQCFKSWITQKKIREKLLANEGGLKYFGKLEYC